MMPKTLASKIPLLKKPRVVMATAACFCLLGFCQTAFSQQLVAKQTNSTNQSVRSPIVNSNELQSSEKSAPKFGPPYHYTADQLTDMLLKVAALKTAPTSGAKILEIFNLPVADFIDIRPKNFPPQQNGFDLESDSRLNFNLAYFSVEESKIAQLSLSWPQNPAERYRRHFPYPPAGLCIDSQKIKEQLEKNGWSLNGVTDLPEFPLFNKYVKGEMQHIRFYYSRENNCLLSINIAWQKY